MDVLRGLALMGILIPNICSFGLPAWAYGIPLGIPLPAFTGPYATINTVVWFTRWLVAEGKMLGLFSLLFGAGIILFTDRLEARAVANGVEIYLRRNMWLLLFGVLHAYFIWYGDVLFFYGLTSLVFLYPCRRLKVRTLLVAGVCVLVVDTVADPIIGYGAFSDIRLHRQVELAEAAQRSGHVPNAVQKAAQQAWAQEQAQWHPDRQAVAADLASMRGGYLAAQEAALPHVLG